MIRQRQPSPETVMNMKDSKRLAIIPARGGSKRIPRKNIRPFRGRPMLEWSVCAALESALFDEVMISTEDQEIADVARAAGATVPFLRSSETATDLATTPDVLLEVLGQYREQGDRFDLACCIYPTAAFVRPEDLAAGLDQLQSSSFDVVMPVTRFDYPIWRSLNRNHSGRIRLNFPEHLNARSQDLPEAYHDAGQWYWFQVPEFERAGVLMGENSGSIILPSSHVQDIDTEEDWIMAEIKHERLFG